MLSIYIRGCCLRRDFPFCPKGAATYRAVNPNRITRVWYRAPGATDWDKTKASNGRWTGSPSASRETRDRTFKEKTDKDLAGND